MRLKGLEGFIYLHRIQIGHSCKAAVNHALHRLIRNITDGFLLSAVCAADKGSQFGRLEPDHGHINTGDSQKSDQHQIEYFIFDTADDEFPDLFHSI